MKQTLKSSLKVISLFGILAVTAAGCTSGGGSSSSGGTTLDPAETLSGAVAKGYVEGARIFADKIPDGSTRGNLQLDRTAGEVFDLSDAIGAYSIEVPADYGDFMLVSQGGTYGDGVAAPPMLAPGDAANITPVTTMVGLNPNLRAKIGEDLFDQDIASSTGANSTVLSLALSAKAALDCLDANVAMTDSQRLSVVSAMADAFEDVEDLTVSSGVVAATRTAIKAVVEDQTVFDPDEVALDGDDTAAAIGDAVEEIATAITTAATSGGTVTEDAVEDTVDTIVEAAKTVVEDAITSITRVSIAGAALRNAANTAVATILPVNTTINLSAAQADTVESIAMTLSARNDFALLKNYTGAKLILDVNDTLSLREATATITGVTVTVSAAAAVTVYLTSSTEVVIEGTDSEGNTVTATLTNSSTTGDDIVTVSGNVVTLDLAALDAKIESAGASAEALFDIGRVGNFKVNMSAVNVPLVSVIKTIAVN